VRKPDDDDMAADLRAMFADERMSLPVGQDAVSSVVAGAGRRRRRRTVAMATGGALGVAAVLLAGGLVAGHLVPGNPVQTGASGGGLMTVSQAQTSAQSKGRSPAQSGVSGGPMAEPGVLGPDGYGDLKLGMSLQQALATKLVNYSGRAINGCYDYSYQTAQVVRPTVPTASTAPTAAATAYYVYIGAGKQPTGVQAISAPSGVLTPEGIGVGSTVTQIRADYPNATAVRGGTITAAVPTDDKAEYRFTVDAKGTVNAVYLSVVGPTCLP
jgi:hypothetical protein